MIDKEKIRNIIELFIAWNGETEPIDVANIDSAVEFIDSSLQKEQNIIEDAPATNYEVPKVKAWIARQDERDGQYPFLMLYFHKPIRNEEGGTWFGYEGIILHQEGKYEFVKWEDEPLEVSLAVFGNSLQEEPVSTIWHNANETPKGAGDKEILVQFADSHASVLEIDDWEYLDHQTKWAYLEDLT